MPQSFATPSPGAGAFQAAQPNALPAFIQALLASQQQAQNMQAQKQQMALAQQQAQQQAQLFPLQLAAQQQAIDTGALNLGVAQRQAKEFLTVPPSYQGISGVNPQQTFSTAAEQNQWIAQNTPEQDAKEAQYLERLEATSPALADAEEKKIESQPGGQARLDRMHRYIESSKAAQGFVSGAVKFSTAELNDKTKQLIEQSREKAASTLKLELQKNNIAFKTTELETKVGIAAANRAQKYLIESNKLDQQKWYQEAKVSYMQAGLQEKDADRAARIEIANSQNQLKEEVNQINLYKQTSKANAATEAPAIGGPSTMQAPGGGITINVGAPPTAQQPAQSNSFSATPAGYQNIVQQAAQQNGVDPNLISAIATQESNWNPQATSSAGAQGIMQLMPDTAKSLGVTKPFDPAQNIMGGTKYFAGLLKKYGGNVDAALAAYNGGDSQAQLVMQGKLPSKPETRNYVHEIHNAYYGGGAPPAGGGGKPPAPNAPPDVNYGTGGQAGVSSKVKGIQSETDPARVQQALDATKTSNGQSWAGKKGTLEIRDAASRRLQELKKPSAIQKQGKPPS